MSYSTDNLNPLKLKPEYDIVIVGAGPAGLSTALHLQQLDPVLAQRTVILEKHHHPRTKVCAGGVMPKGDAVLADLGLDATEVPSTEVKQLDLRYESLVSSIRREPYVCRMVQRDQFDHWLAQAAVHRGIDLIEGIAVRNLTRTEDSVEVETSDGILRAKVVVGADGSSSRVRKCLLPWNRQQYAKTVEVDIPTDGWCHEHQTAIMEFDIDLPGYRWRFPNGRDGSTFDTWGVYHSQVGSPAVRSLIPSLLPLPNIDSENPARFKSSPIQTFHPFNSFSAPRVLLVGDAAGAGLVLGEGISFALRYGKVAAQTLSRAFSTADFSLRKYRFNLMRSSVGRILLLRYLAAQLLYRLPSRLVMRAIWFLIGPAAEGFFIKWK